MLASFALVLISVLLAPRAIRGEDMPFLKFDYCTLKCGNDHSACKCGKPAFVSPREPFTDFFSMVEFRKMMVAEHNHWRNLVAMGNDTLPPPGFAPSASNMMIMNYDLELEYIVMCYLYRTHEKGHDKCRVPMDENLAGQNIHYRSHPELTHDGYKSPGNYTRGWYNEGKYLFNDTITKFTGKGNGGQIGHWTQLMWWSANKVGCARKYHPKMGGGNINYAVLCNYASTVSKNGGNMLGAPIYKPGAPCSDCFGGTKCETKEYPGLCGKLLPIPEEEIPLGAKEDAKGGATRAGKGALGVVTVGVLLVLVWG